MPDGDPIEAAEALIAAGRAGEAANALRARLAAGRGGALARITLVKALLAAGEVPQALEEARESAALHANVAPVLAMLGEALLAAHQLPTAIAELQRALRLDPGDGRARGLLARAWLVAGEADKALEAGLEDEALIAEAHAMKAAPRSSSGYVRHLFDQFAPDYDRRMREHLAYAAPEILFQLLHMTMPGRAPLSILDLGCGTGLAGEVFQKLAARLDGVDLSPAMIERARARNIYRSLAVADLETALEKPQACGLAPRYELILAADTLVYLGDLAPVFRGAAALLAGDGAFLFTVEKAAAEFELGPKRRWRHSEAYLRRAAAEAGLAVAGLVEAAPRQESRKAVEGFAVALVP